MKKGRESREVCRSRNVPAGKKTLPLQMHRGNREYRRFICHNLMYNNLKKVLSVAVFPKALKQFR